VRIDDLDAPRVRAGADRRILDALLRLGLTWDGEIVYQGSRAAVYAAALDRIRASGRLYACTCTRRETAGRPYSGRCRTRALADGPRRALRLRVDTEPVRFEDGILGPCARDVAAETGDIVVRRADGLFAYHLACVVDDAAQGVTHVVRGADLLESTAAQCQVQDMLGLPRPVYCHLPMVIDADGRKISKSLAAEDALLRTRPAALLVAALAFLGQAPDPQLAEAPVSDVLTWGVAHWRRDRVPHVPGRAPAV
jgi:glutamyl-Q tRNA(Asp) synthetase